MLQKFLFFFILTFAVKWTNIDGKKVTPEDFVKESMPILDEVKVECAEISDNIVNYVSSEKSDKIDVLNHLENCSKKLKDIATEAATFDLTKIEDVQTLEIIKNLRNLEEPMKMGVDLIKVGEYIKSFLDMYEKEDIEHYDDNDLLYSLGEIEVGKFLTRSEDIAEMNHYWKQVADKVGSNSWENFFDFITLIQTKARESDMYAAEYWYPNFSKATMDEIENVMMDIAPFYAELFTFIRHKLYKRYGVGVIKLGGTIPETLYRPTEDRTWSENSYFEDEFPAENIPALKNTENALNMAEDFYKSIGFDELEFWKKHIFRNTEEDDECSENFEDLRADNITFQYCDLTQLQIPQVHEYFGRIYSGVYEKELPWFLWHDNQWGKILGGAVSLASRTKDYQTRKHLLSKEETSDDWMRTVNFRLAYEQFFNVVIKYVNLRTITDLLSYKTEKSDVNEHYWEMFRRYGGVDPPLDRTEDSMDLSFMLIRDVFDNKNLLNDFMNTFYVYDVYKAACQRAGHTGPLHECDFYDTKTFGEDMKKVLLTGGLKPVSAAIEPLIPSYGNLSAKAMLDYFEPTYNWLVRYNKKHNLKTNWSPSLKQFRNDILSSEEDALKFVEDASQKIYKLYDEIAVDLFEKKFDGDKVDFESEELFSEVSKTTAAAKELRDISEKAKQYDNSRLKSKTLRRDLSKIAQIADVFVLGKDFEEIMLNKQLLFNMSTDIDVVKYNDNSESPENVAYNPYILNVIKTSGNPTELKYYWEKWRSVNGDFARRLLVQIFESLEKAADILEISTTDLWFKHYGGEFVKKMEKVIEQVKPFYQQLHLYVARKLQEKYTSDEFSMGFDSIPDQLVEQVLSQIWSNESIVEDDFPFDNLPPYETIFKTKKYDAMQLLKIAEEFYQSMGFKPLEESFWSERLKLKEDSETDGSCHAIIYDMTPKVYMKYCERVSFRKLLQAQGNLGRVFYAAEKKDLPAYHFSAYNLEFPVGEAVILSASSPKHMEKIGLIDDFPVSKEVLMNRLIRMAIHTMFNLHKYFVHTKVIAEYIEGDILRDELTKYYWKYMITYAGIEPPVDRTASNFDFPFEFYTDLEKNHQVEKFVEEVLGYRFYERLCKISGHEGDLNNCDFSGSVEAGNALREMMKLGSTLPSKNVLKVLLKDFAGYSGNSMLTYYAPLEKWLTKSLEDYCCDRSSFDSFRQFLNPEYFV